MTYLILGVGLVLVTVAVFALGWQGCLHWTDRVTRLADPAPLPSEFVSLPRAGYFAGAADPGFELAASYGPFPADTGPLLLWGEKASANDALAREVRWMIEEAHRRIGPVQ